MKTLLLALLVVSAMGMDPFLAKFNSFVAKYEKKYESLAETEYRFGVFKENLARIEKLNAEHVALGGAEVFGINAFADQTQEEFSVRLMKNLPPREPDNTPYEHRIEATGDVDWRLQGAITPVKDQGQCGSCWAHSADEAQESFHFLKYGSLIPMSVQQCTACTYTYNGCNGGWPHDAYVNAITKRNGIDADSSYPYSIPNAGNCKFGASGNSDAPVSNDAAGSYKSVAKGQLQTALNSTGPVSVCVAAESWQLYTGGILKNCPGSVDHCVQAVGYTLSGSEPYWVVRNSWGTGWGEKGYIYLDMSVNKGDICLIQDYMTFPLIS